MDNIAKLKRKYPGLSFKSSISNDTKIPVVLVSGFKGNDEIELTFNEYEITELDSSEETEEAISASEGAVDSESVGVIKSETEGVEPRSEGVVESECEGADESRCEEADESRCEEAVESGIEGVIGPNYVGSMESDSDGEKPGGEVEGELMTVREAEPFILIEGLNQQVEEYSRLQQRKCISLTLLEKCAFFKEYLGVYVENEFQIILSSNGLSSTFVDIDELLKENPFEMKLVYKGKLLEIKIFNERQIFIKEAFSHLAWINEKFRDSPVISISGAVFDGNSLEEDALDIVNCVIFDLDYMYNVLFEPVKLDSPSLDLSISAEDKFPQEIINLSFKRYIPELIEYYRTARKINNLPFKFLCYYYIIEYFLDKSAFIFLSKKLKDYVYKPDFYINLDKYVTEVFHLFQQEAQKNTPDNHKIERVLKEFIELNEIKTVCNQDLIDRLNKKVEMKNATNTLELEPILFDTQDNFIKTLTKRIYRMRCSIVHSNPDFDPNKAIPFMPSLENLVKLKAEIELIHEVAKIIIYKSNNPSIERIGC